MSASSRNMRRSLAAWAVSGLLLSLIAAGCGSPSLGVVVRPSQFPVRFTNSSCTENDNTVSYTGSVTPADGLDFVQVQLQVHDSKNVFGGFADRSFDSVRADKAVQLRLSTHVVGTPTACWVRVWSSAIR